ncbi:BatA domain-containing protein [Galbibacter sp. PAP.153]|uniref:BatA domain-containing protein n=1 Tax=Galbibacter sp. PAP.153 TaxID=3104623 RepID=UPI00300B3E69
MQFKHPEILWALFLLLIPIIIHLFQLRRFKKETFTNVQFLKQLAQKTRKSSQLKKWLILLIRMLAFAAIITAFAQPYLANRNIVDTTKETVVYLDNSFSMQLKGAQGPLLTRAINEFIGNIPANETFSLFTNTENYQNIQVNDIKNELLATSYSSTQLPLNEIFLKGQQYFKGENSIKNFVVISDFQQRKPDTLQDSNIESRYVQLSPVSKENIAIDSAYIKEKETNGYNLEVLLSTNGEYGNTPIALYNNDNLIAKTAVSFSNNKGIASFTVPNGVLKGRISIDDNGLQYDNTLFISINKEEKLNVLSINGAADVFLKKIFTKNEFNYASVPVDAIDYNSLPNQNFIVLNEVENIPNALIMALKSAVSKGIYICIIASNKVNQETYNQLLGQLSGVSIEGIKKQEQLITQIAFEHPLFQQVFEKKVVNFQYPKSKLSYAITGNSNKVISFADGSPFLSENNHVYLFSSPLNTNTTNFQSSPLIVPVFYNMAKQSLALPNLYYSIGENNQFDVKATLGNDQIVTLKNKETSFIPLQQTFTHHVNITTTDLPAEAGNYSVNNGNEAILNLSYNYNRNESKLNYLDLNNFNTTNTYTDIADVFKNIKSENNVNALWKWFVIFALVCFCIELLILKYFK